MSCFFLDSWSGSWSLQLEPVPTRIQLLGASSLHPSMSQECDDVFWSILHMHIYHLYLFMGFVGSGVDLDPCFGVVWCPAPLALRSTRMTLTGTTTWSWRCLIALRQFFERGDGLPTVKDLQACFYCLPTWHSNPKWNSLNNPLVGRPHSFWQPCCTTGHKPLYAQRGGKRAIKDQFSTVVSISISPKLKVPLTCPLLQDWGNDQAQKLRSMLGHLHALARKADAARWAERGCGCSVFTVYIFVKSWQNVKCNLQETRKFMCWRPSTWRWLARKRHIAFRKPLHLLCHEGSWHQIPADFWG